MFCLISHFSGFEEENSRRWEMGLVSPRQEAGGGRWRGRFSHIKNVRSQRSEVEDGEETLKLSSCPAVGARGEASPQSGWQVSDGLGPRCA